MWWKSAVRRSFGFLSAAFRIRATACGTLARHWVRCVLWQSGFPSVEALSSGDSAEARAPLFAALTGRTASSDFSKPFITGFGFLLPYTAPYDIRGSLKTSQGPGKKACERAWVLRHRGTRRHLTKTMPAMLPSTDLKASAPRTIAFSVLHSPAHPYRCRCFACPLAETDARLAEKRGLVTPSFRGTCTPCLLPVRLAHQNRTCGHYRIRFLACESRSWMLIHDPQVGKCPKSDASSPARLSTFVSLSRYEAQSLLVFPSSGSAHAAPTFPRSGPGGPGSPLSSVLCGRYDPLTCVPSAYLFANRYRGALPGVCAFARALPPSGQRRTVGRGLLFSAGIPFPAVCLPRTRQSLPSSLASHPVALRRSRDPGRPLAPRP